MLDRLIMKYLSSTGRKAYWIGQLTLVAAWLIYLFGVAHYDIDDNGTRNMLFVGLFAIIICWGGLCLVVWPKSKNPDTQVAEK